MTTQYTIIGTISGQTGLVAKLFSRNGDTVLYTSDSVTERMNALGQYLCTFGEATVIPAGVYRLIAFTSGGLPLASGLRAFLGTDTETATQAPEPAELDSASVTAVQSGLATAAALTAMNNLSAAQVTTAVLVSQLTEAYAADGVPPTLTQAVMLILQHLSESSIVSTTKTVKKLDRTTSAATFTLDSATDPTSITRTT